MNGSPPHHEADSSSNAAYVVRPANQASFQDLQTVFGPRGGEGSAHYCQCQRFKTASALWWQEHSSRVPVPVRARRLYDESRFGEPEAPCTSGILAFLGPEPVGWCRVGPRSTFVRLGRVPWAGRAEDKADDRVWAIVCLITRAGYRRRGVTYALARAAVTFARERGARALEGYPMSPEPGKEVTWGELAVGKQSIFAAAGFSEVTHPTLRRVVMRIEFS